MRQIGEVVTVCVGGKPPFYARVESICPDIKPKWYEFEFTILSFPLKKATWLLREEYIDGKEFTMEGIPVSITSLPNIESVAETFTPGFPGNQRKGKVLSLSDRRNKKMKMK